MLPQQYCLRWRYHHSNLQAMFSQLLEREAFCDVTLACEGRTIKAHKIVLSACSTYFDTILSQYEEKDPILIMKDVKYVDIKCLVEFMYKGEINVDHCHLATLLKTAEELRIKGLAEVSWKDDETSSTSNEMNGEQASASPAASAIDATKDSNKRKRGRPPIDDDIQPPPSQFPKIVSVSGGASTSGNDDNYSNEHSPSSQHMWEDEMVVQQTHDDSDHQEMKNEIKIKTEYPDDTEVIEQNDYHRNEVVTPNSKLTIKPLSNSTPTVNQTQSQQPPAQQQQQQPQQQQSQQQPPVSGITAALEKEWSDVIKMNDYLNTGRRQQFWEEPFTKRVMDAIKTKNLEMKIAAELLGVSYGTLYGRYRDAYGCLKHPYRWVRDFWTEQGPTDILLKLKRKEITLFRAAEQLNVTPQTLSNYLISMSVLDNESSNTGHMNALDTYDELETDEEPDAILPDAPTACTSNSVLANCPDITIIKKEKIDSMSGKVNNNSDHADRQFGNDQTNKRLKSNAIPDQNPKVLPVRTMTFA